MLMHEESAVPFHLRDFMETVVASTSRSLVSFEVFHALSTVVLFSGERERTKRRSPCGMGDMEVTGSVGDGQGEGGEREGGEGIWKMFGMTAGNERGKTRREGRGRATR